MKIQIGNASITPKKVPGSINLSPEEIGKYMKRKHSKNDMIVFCMNDNFLLSPLAQVLHIHQYFLNNFIRKKGSYCISKLK